MEDWVRQNEEPVTLIPNLARGYVFHLVRSGPDGI